jgi:hypothetical protein
MRGFKANQQRCDASWNDTSRSPDEHFAPDNWFIANLAVQRRLELLSGVGWRRDVAQLPTTPVSWAKRSP